MFNDEYGDVRQKNRAYTYDARVNGVKSIQLNISIVSHKVN